MSFNQGLLTGFSGRISFRVLIWRKSDLCFQVRGPKIKASTLAELAAENPTLLDTFTRASEVLGTDLWRICQSDPDSSLNQTEITQPVLLAASVAVGTLCLERGGP